MEKYRKFDDPATGVNPFIPLSETPRPTWMRILRIPGAIFLTIVKIPFVLILLAFMALGELIKLLLIFGPLKRVYELIIGHLLARMLITAFSAANIQAIYHKEHKEFDFVKA